MNFTRKNKRTNKIENVGYMELVESQQQVSMYIYGDIVSSEWDKWSEEDTCPQDIVNFMAQIDNNAPLTVYINSCGGDVFAGIGIYNILSRHTGHIIGIVDGLAASIASVILMACDEIHVATGAQIMIHKPSSACWGNADDFRKLADELDRCQKTILDIYMTRAQEGVEEEEIQEKINAETWLTGAEAALIFNIETEEKEAAAACVGWLHDTFRNAPEGIKTETVEDAVAREQQEEAAIIAELDLYGI